MKRARAAAADDHGGSADRGGLLHRGQEARGDPEGDLADRLEPAQRRELPPHRAHTRCTSTDLPKSPVDKETVAEISTVTPDGNTLIYTDAAAKRIGFVDINDPAKPVGYRHAFPRRTGPRRLTSPRRWPR